MESKSEPLLIYFPVVEERQRMVRLALVAGFAPLVCETREAFIQAILSRKNTLIAFSVSPADLPLIQAMRIFREKIEFRFIQFLVILNVVNKDLVHELIKAGFYHILSWQQSDSEFINKVHGFITTTNSSNERRQHVRIQLMDYENAKLILNLGNARKVTTIVRNISMGGLAIYFRDRIYVRFSKDDILKDAVLLIKDLDISLDVRIVGIMDMGLQLQFHDVPDSQLDRIAQFIQERVQFEIG